MRANRGHAFRRTHDLPLVIVDLAILVLVCLVDKLQEVAYNRRLYRARIADSVHSAQWRTLDAQVCVDLDGALVHLVREQLRHTLRERVHRDTRTPQHEVRRDLARFDLPVRPALSVRHLVVFDGRDTGGGDEVNLVARKLVLCVSRYCL